MPSSAFLLGQQVLPGGSSEVICLGLRCGGPTTMTSYLASRVKGWQCVHNIQAVDGMMQEGGGTDTALRTRHPTRQLNIVGLNEEDLSNLLSPNSLVSATSGRLRPSTPAFQMSANTSTACQHDRGSRNNQTPITVSQRPSMVLLILL